MLAELRTPAQFEQAAQFIQPQELDQHVNISNDPGQHLEWLQEYIELGFKEIVLHNVNKKQEQFLEIFGKKILPELS